MSVNREVFENFVRTTLLPLLMPYNGNGIEYTVSGSTGQCLNTPPPKCTRYDLGSGSTQTFPPSFDPNPVVILILHLSLTSVRDSGRSREAIRPELKTFLSLYRWTWDDT